jgi:bacterioferritin-associated ferredoxin
VATVKYKVRRTKDKVRKRQRAARNRQSSIVNRQSPVVVCRCEEVSEADVRRVIRMGYHSLEAVKRVLRTGMGHCQGRGCLKLVARLIQEETGIPTASQRLPFPRPPLKPLPLGLLGSGGLSPHGDCPQNRLSRYEQEA